MPKPKNDIPIVVLRDCFDLDAETGVLTWRVRPRAHFLNAQAHSAWNRKFAGKVAGRRCARRYNSIAVTTAGKKRRPYAHRVIWALSTGSWPTEEIDHRNGAGTENRLKNLREASPSQNQHNKKIRRDNSSGFTGVRRHRPTNRWRAEITVHGKTRSLGYFATPEAAFAAYLAAKAYYHPTQPIPRDYLVS
jgi:HNH endonuclease/AP2 domain